MKHLGYFGQCIMAVMLCRRTQDGSFVMSQNSRWRSCIKMADLLCHLNQHGDCVVTVYKMVANLPHRKPNFDHFVTQKLNVDVDYVTEIVGSFVI